MPVDKREVLVYSTAIRANGRANGPVLGALGVYFDWQAQGRSIVETEAALPPQVVERTEVMLLDANGRTAATGAGSFPIDLDTSGDGDYLYVLAAGTDRILVYAIGGDGSLSSRPGVGGLPGAANGLVAR